MKLPTDHIFRIVHAMSASEKRYFKRHYASEASLLTVLFDYINQMKSYDEDQVKEHFSDSKLSKNLKVYKVQLADLILKSLVSYHSKNSIHSKIRIGLEEVDILIDKQLFDIALSKIKRIKSVCLEYEAFEHLFPILAIELSLNSFYSADTGSIQSTTFKELKESVLSVQEILSLQRYSHQLSDIKNHLSTQTLSEDQHQTYSTLLKKLLSNLESNNSSSFREQYYQHHVISMIYRLVHNDPEQEHHYKQEQIALFEGQEKITKAYPTLYFASMHNYLSSCWKLRRLEALEKGIDDLQSFISNNTALEPNKLFVYYLQLLLLFGQDITKLEESFEKEVLIHIKKYKQEKDYLSNLIYLRLAIVHLSMNRHKKVQFFLRRISDNTSTMNENFGVLVVIVELVSHYHSNDIFLVQNMLTALSRKKKKKATKDNELFAAVLSFFQKVIKEKDEASVGLLATDFKTTLEDMKYTALYTWLKEYLFCDWLDLLIHKSAAVKPEPQLFDFIKK